MRRASLRRKHTRHRGTFLFPLLQGSLLAPSATCYVIVSSFSHSGAGVILTSHSALQKMGSRTSDFPEVTQLGLHSGIPPPSPQLPLLPGSPAPAVSCSEVSSYFYSGARGSWAAEPCRLEGSRTPASAGKGRFTARTYVCLGACISCIPRCPGLSCIQKLLFWSSEQSTEPD